MVQVHIGSVELWLTNEFVGLIPERSRGVLFCILLSYAGVTRGNCTYMYDRVSTAPNFVQ